MGVVINKQRAEAIKQIDLIEVTGAGAGSDTITMTVNLKDVVVTIGTGTTTAQIAQSIMDALNASTRIDGTGSNTNTSNVGGQEFGEFSEFTAVIYSTSNTIVRLIANQAGVPFTLSVAKTGTVTFTHTASSQAATGPEWWNNGDNWNGGNAPVTGDHIILAESSIGFKYGLPTNLQIRNEALEIHKSFIGWLGLPPINRTNAGKPYNEYRPRYPVFYDGDGITARNPFFEIGRGVGLGSPLLNIEYDAQHVDATSTWRIFDTGTPQPNIISPYALHIATDGTSDNNDFFFMKGYAVLGYEPDGKSATITNVSVGHSGSQPSDVSLLLDDMQGGAGISVTQNGGIVTYAGVSSTITLWELNNGTMNYIGSAAITAADLYVGQLFIIGNPTITTLTIGQRAIADFNRGTESLTITNLDMHAGAHFLDDNDRVAVTNGPDLIRCGMEDVVIRRGKHLRVTKGAVS